jgi:hypothetical protein
MKLLFSLLTFLLITAAKGQNQLDTTRLTIIGTIHNGNKHFGHRILLQLLKDIKPDIILSEQDNEYKRVFGLLTANFLKIWHPSIEQLALQRYTRGDKKCKVLPFDIFIDDRKKYLADKKINAAKISEALITKLSGNFMSRNDSTAYTKYMRIRNSYYNKIMDTTLERINRKDIIDVTRMIFNLDKDLIMNLANKYLTDTSLVHWLNYEIDFWDQRNDYMVKQILNYTDLYKGQRIVVLTGLNHKYFLLDKINEANKNVRIVEF